MRALGVSAAVAACLVVAAPAGAATFFENPNHNIGCVIDGKIGARCDVREHTWTPPPKPASCPVDWGFGLTVGTRGVARWVCAGDTVFGGKRVLGYRKSIVKGRFKCTNYRNGVRCVNTRNGHGFKIARRAARWF
jgi:Family of unknown function (DUF6636)